MGKVANKAKELVGINRKYLDVCQGAWCASFVSLVISACKCYDYTNVISISCTQMTKNMTKAGYKKIKEPVVDAFIFFDWDRIQEEKPVDHVGIIVDVQGDYIIYVNGNGNDSERVTQQSINKYSSSIYAMYIEPDHEEEEEQIKYEDVKIELWKGHKSNLIKICQAILGINADGYFGPETEQAVLNFQAKQGIIIDGIIGNETFNELFKVM